MATTDVSVLPGVIGTLVTRWVARPGLNGVRIAATAPASDDRSTELVYLEQVSTWEISHPVTGGGRPTVARDEDGILPWIVEVRSRTDALASLERAIAIVDELSLEVAASPRLGGGIAGLVAVTAESMSIDLTQADRKPLTKISANFRVRGKLR